MEPLLPPAEQTGRPQMIDFRAVINALRYLVRTGCEWRTLPNNFPPYQTVYYWLRRLMRRMLFQTIHELALMSDRMCCGRDVVPTASVIDSQSVKTPAAHRCRYRLPAAGNEPDACRCGGFDRCADGARCFEEAMAVGEAIVRRRCLRPAHFNG